MCNGADIGCFEDELEKKDTTNGIVIFDLIGVENLENDKSPFGEKCRKCLQEKGASVCPRKK